ncbi:hypothetical protein GCM10017655_18910 [Pseudomonas turukhanskensis]|uniref:Uncharacterized protein n=1 Tax=Pseudomonas turukhanskensis TaxID=1806536 RepID=A0A9W6K6D4_9PSED|nr:hypothetical protein GCM10017655_18910 [Pseudomonas turukhanskensis]
MAATKPSNSTTARAKKVLTLTSTFATKYGKRLPTSAKPELEVTAVQTHADYKSMTCANTQSRLRAIGVRLQRSKRFPRRESACSDSATDSPSPIIKVLAVAIAPACLSAPDDSA